MTPTQAYILARKKIVASDGDLFDVNKQLESSIGNVNAGYNPYGKTSCEILQDILYGEDFSVDANDILYYGVLSGNQVENATTNIPCITEADFKALPLQTFDTLKAGLNFTTSDGDGVYDIIIAIPTKYKLVSAYTMDFDINSDLLSDFTCTIINIDGVDYNVYERTTIYGGFWSEANFSITIEEV